MCVDRLLHVHETICPRVRDEADAATSARFQSVLSFRVGDPTGVEADAG